jgi:hypothetical protein
MDWIAEILRDLIIEPAARCCRNINKIDSDCVLTG